MEEIENYYRDLKQGWYKKNTLVPPELSRELIRVIYELPLSGHLGIMKIIKRIPRGYLILQLKIVVKEVLAECALCIRNKNSRHKLQGLLQLMPVLEVL